MKLTLNKEEHVGHLAGEYDLDCILEFIKEHDIENKLEHVGSCNYGCEHCSVDDYYLWREDYVMFQGEEVDFSIYKCSKCGKWTDFID